MSSNTILLWEPNRAAYGDFAPYLELFLLKESEPRGLVLVLPGGSYTMRADHEGAPVAQRFNELGFHAAVLHYRVAPRRYPDALTDALRAVQMLRLMAARAPILEDKIAVLGFSAGGHLAACAGSLAGCVEVIANDPADNLASLPDALILCYPVITSGEFTHAGSFEALTGKDKELRDFLSVENRIDSNTPPTFLWHTAEDDAVPVQNSLLYTSAMREAKRPVELHVFPEGGHGIGLAQGYSAEHWPELAGDFLARLGFKPVTIEEKTCLKEPR